MGRKGYPGKLKRNPIMYEERIRGREVDSGSGGSGQRGLRKKRKKAKSAIWGFVCRTEKKCYFIRVA